MLRMIFLLYFLKYKQVEPLFYMIQSTLVLFTRKVVIKAFRSIFYVLHSSFNNAFSILVYKRMKMMSRFKNLHAGGYHLPPSEETGYILYLSKT
jgi:hypothetical protein